MRINLSIFRTAPRATFLQLPYQTPHFISRAEKAPKQPALIHSFGTKKTTSHASRHSYGFIHGQLSN